MLLPWLVGPKVAKEIILLGEDRLSAARAEALGIVNRVVPPAELETAALAATSPRGNRPRPRPAHQARDQPQLRGARLLGAPRRSPSTWRWQIEGEGLAGQAPLHGDRRRDGLKAALAWRDARFPKSRR